MQYVPAYVQDAYQAKFHEPIPVGPWSGVEDMERATREVLKAIQGKRGRLDAAEFPLDCPPGATL